MTDHFTHILLLTFVILFVFIGVALVEQLRRIANTLHDFTTKGQIKLPAFKIDSRVTIPPPPFKP